MKLLVRINIENENIAKCKWSSEVSKTLHVPVLLFVFLMSRDY